MMMAESKTMLAVEMTSESSAPILYCTLEDFLQDVPLHSLRSIRPILFFAPGEIMFPDEIRMHCDHHKCDGIRRHPKLSQARFLTVDESFYHYCVYRCINCNVSTKVFVTKSFQAGTEAYHGVSTKIYQEPAFGH